jgi:hypothetical protein
MKRNLVVKYKEVKVISEFLENYKFGRNLYENRPNESQD